MSFSKNAKINRSLWYRKSTLGGISSEVFWDKKRAFNYDTDTAWVEDPYLLEAFFRPLGVPASPGVFVDLAGGPGPLARAAQQRGWQKVFTVDVSPAMLAQVYEGVTPILGSADEALPFDTDSVDVIVGRHLLPYVKDPAAVLAKAASVAKRVLVANFAAPDENSQALFEEYAKFAVADSRRFLLFGDVERIAQEAGLFVTYISHPTSVDSYGHRISYLSEPERDSFDAFMASWPQEMKEKFGLDPVRRTFSKRPWEIAVLQRESATKKLM